MRSLPFHYLGVPLNSKKLNLVSCEPLLHQTKAKFSSWSVKSLSFAGRLLLIKTVIAGIKTFGCSSFILPKACVRRITSSVVFSCGKVMWRAETQQELVGKRAGSVWVAWFKEMILKGSLANYWTTKPSSSFSWLANKLLKLKETVFPLIKLQLQNDHSACFWFDNWTPFGSLYLFLNGSTSCLGIPLKATVGSLVTNSIWSLPPARSDKQLQLQTFLTTVQLTEGEDHYDWEINGTKSSRFQTWKIYTYLRPELAKVRWEGVVWTKRGITRHNFHIRLVVQDRIPTRDRLIRWGLQVSSVCLLCNAADELRDHLFQECSFIFDVWALLHDDSDYNH
ncbi:PREDICTED: uncharacterized protein LOC106335396 [Brassica oleracea var. oleracea]|uniref:uncharacterized protein LOC106335396 n=1 Tax=Brassica oleracea var. oleracea TaxID=109376 RepID=UPI0006A727EB|nr:PREDICTED: uncharacterized protein LOC106335396 [Brassica oleracea var. oleracea]